MRSDFFFLYPTTPLFAEASVLAQLLVKFAFGGKLQHEENAAFIVKIAVQTEDVWMSVLKSSRYEPSLSRRRERDPDQARLKLD
jgi:hypothetical protein